MNEDELLEEAKKLVQDFHTLSLVDMYSVTKKSIEEDEDLQSLLKDRKRLQATIKKADDIEKDAIILQCQKLKIQYDEDPRVINLEAYRKELISLLKPLIDLK